MPVGNTGGLGNRPKIKIETRKSAKGLITWSILAERSIKNDCNPVVGCLLPSLVIVPIALITESTQ